MLMRRFSLSHGRTRLAAAAQPALLLAAACWGAACVAAPHALPAPAVAHTAHYDTVRVMTYNIFAGNDLQRRSSLERVAALIDSLGADIVLLQEVDRLTVRSGRVDQASVLAAATGLHMVFGRSIDHDGGEYGNAVLSRWPITASRVVPLDSLLPEPVAAGVQEARTLLHVVVEAPPGPLHVLNTHLDHRAGSTIRPLQSLALLAHVAGAVPPGASAILGGDLNAAPDAVEVRALSVRFTDAWSMCGAGPGLTFRTDRPDRRIDYILMSGAACAAAFVLEHPFSDHLPVIADILIERMIR
jgi:endonuclease/exonuclease/phosphatase family metal-dependent hydrolase